MGDSDAREVVVTGLGPVSAIGIGRKPFLHALSRGACGIAEVTAFDIEGLSSRLAAEVVELEVEHYLRSRKNYLDRNSELAFAGAELALRDAGLEPPFDERFGLFVGTEWGNVESLAAFAGQLHEKGPRLVPPFIFQHVYPNTTASLLSIEYGIQGYNETFVGSSTSGAQALAAVVRSTAQGRTDAAVVGGVDALCAEIYHGCARSGIISPAKGTGSEGARPFASDHNGAVLAEGAAFLVVEERQNAISRGARPLALLRAAALAAGPGQSLQRALDEGAASPNGVTAVVAGANGDPEQDDEVLAALHAVFGGTLPPVITLTRQVGDVRAALVPLGVIAGVAASRHGRSVPLNDCIGSTGPLRRLERGSLVLVDIYRGRSGAASILLETE